MRILPRPVLPALLLIAASLGAAAHAQTPAPSGAGLPLWEVGVFAAGASQTAYPGSDQQVSRALALPFFIYRGRVLRADGETAGLRALRTDRLELDIGVAGAFGTRGDDIEARRGMPELGTLVEFGPRLKVKLGDGLAGGRLRAELPLRGVFDLSDGGAHRGLSFEPRLVFERQAQGGWRYNASVGAILGDAKLARTFYEVTPLQATAQRAAYSARSGLVAWRLATSFSKPLGPDWRLFGYARLDTVSGAANADSPLVRQSNGLTTGLGLAYTWQRSTARASD